MSFVERAGSLGRKRDCLNPESKTLPKTPLSDVRSSPGISRDFHGRHPLVFDSIGQQVCDIEFRE